MINQRCIRLVLVALAITLANAKTMVSYSECLRLAPYAKALGIDGACQNVLIPTYALAAKPICTREFLQIMCDAIKANYTKDNVADFCGDIGLNMPIYPPIDESEPVGLTPENIIELTKNRLGSMWMHTPVFDKFNALVLSDIHLDIRYTAGTAVTGCGMPADDKCCKVGTPSAGVGSAGIYGERTCNTPITALEAILDDARKIHTSQTKLNAIFLIGDYIADWYNATHENITETWSVVSDAISRYLPGVPVIAVKGNHDGFPLSIANILTPDWSYPALFDTFSNVLVQLSDEDNQTAHNFGYYMASIGKNHGNAASNNEGIADQHQQHSNRPRKYSGKLNVIVLNTDIGQFFNFKNNIYHGIMDQIDPTGQLKWLDEKLSMLERARGSAVILMHEPLASTGQDLRPEYSRAIYNILVNHHRAVKTIFNGHRHGFGIAPIRDMSNKHMLFTRVAAPAITPPNIPGYLIASLNRFDLSLEDLVARRFNPSQANADGHPTFGGEGSISKFFGVPSLSPKAVQTIMNSAVSSNVTEDGSVIRKMYQMWRGVDGPVSEYAKKWLICSLDMSSRTDEFRSCTLNWIGPGAANCSEPALPSGWPTY